ncbi:MAG: sulfurtransferase [Gammaproteobacteria bacterium]
MALTLDTPLVSTQWLEEHLDDPALRIIDCSMVMQPNDDGTFGFVAATEVFSKGHINNSIYVDLGGELSDQNHEMSLMMPSPEVLAETLRLKGIGEGTAVVCYDRSNHAWASRVWWMLKTCGFDNAAVLNGGYKKWLAESRAISTEITEYPEADSLPVKPRSQQMVNKERVLSVLEKDDAQLLHSLPLPMFTGEVNAYGRPGRIPGSKHMYCENLLNAQDNTFIDHHEILSKYEAAGVSKDQPIIAYCGGGIAASANALALTLTGHDNVAVYDGSLSEWCADPNLPMEVD